MKKQSIVALLVFVIVLAAISLLTLPSKIVNAKSKIEDPIYNIGSAVADFNLKNYDGTQVSLASNTSAKGYILVFTCNECPFAKAYHKRLQALHSKYAGLGYPVLALNPNSAGHIEAENAAANAQTAKNEGFTFNYLADENQQQARLFAAKKTPTVCLLQRNGNGFVLRYTGAIDNNAQDEAGANEKYVEKAINELLVGRAISTTSTKSVGCGIKWKNA
jgi:peroxiredoxin